ncbi:hypothetical protein GLOIN_2v1834448 [Rhizophagus irregularis DAOM 181602=DAOM 197198]|nr:hypothetical protein GLOIN_2v1834448 [Rhizophagus irregularis DAOM 181602=DAOM 197198]
MGKIKSPYCHQNNLQKLSLFFESDNIDNLKGIKSKLINDWLAATLNNGLSTAPVEVWKCGSWRYRIHLLLEKKSNIASPNRSSKEIRINLELKKSKLEIELQELGKLEDKIQKIKADLQKIEGVLIRPYMVVFSLIQFLTYKFSHQ